MTKRSSSKARPPIRWRGPLAQPIKWRGASPAQALNRPDPQAELREAHKYFSREQLKKVPLLAEQLGLAPDADLSILLLRLAMEFVPGFRLQLPQGRVGRRPKWDLDRELGLIADVEVVRREKGGCPATQAFGALFTRYPDRYGKPTNRKKASRTLANRHSEALKKVVNAGLRRLGEADDTAMDYLIASHAADPSVRATARARLLAIEAQLGGR